MTIQKKAASEDAAFSCAVNLELLRGRSSNRSGSFFFLHSFFHSFFSFFGFFCFFLGFFHRCFFSRSSFFDSRSSSRSSRLSSAHDASERNSNKSSYDSGQNFFHLYFLLKMVCAFPTSTTHANLNIHVITASYISDHLIPVTAFRQHNLKSSRQYLICGTRISQAARHHSCYNCQIALYWRTDRSWRQPPPGPFFVGMRHSTAHSK